MNPSDQIKHFALEHGADLVAITHARPFTPWRQDVESARRAGLLPPVCVAKISSDPADLLPEARSIIVFGVRYEGLAAPGPASVPRIGCGIRRRLLCREVGASIADRLNELGGRAVYNAEIPIKRAAVRAGLGWLGRNSLFTTREFGSAIRISTVITDLELDIDEGICREGCGNCTLCMDRCPKQALHGEGVFDATRCLCYLTEYEVPIPGDFREAFANRTIGCEECQLACPHNQGVSFVSWQGQDLLELAEQAASDFHALNAWFARKFDFTLKTRELLLRTLAINLANSHIVDAIPLLERLAEEPDEMLSDCVSWALDRLRT